MPRTLATDRDPAWTDLGHGWARNERGDTVRTLTEIEDVLAEHDFGWDREGRRTAFTRLTRGKSWADGGTFIASLDGHLPNDHVVKFSHHSAAYRLKLIDATSVERRAA